MTIARHQQLFRHDPDNGIYGDCFRTVIACLLNLQPGDVTHFCDGPDDGQMWERVRAYLEPRGLAFLEIPFVGEALPDVESILAVGAAYSQGLHWVLTGKSRNGVNHIVICRGAEIVHDTSIDQSGIVGPGIDGNWWVGWLVGRLPCDEVAA